MRTEHYYVPVLSDRFMQLIGGVFHRSVISDLSDICNLNLAAGYFVLTVLIFFEWVNYQSASLHLDAGRVDYIP